MPVLPQPGFDPRDTPRGPPANHEALTDWSPISGRVRAQVAGRGDAADERSIARHRDRGKLPVRERIERLTRTGIGLLEN